MRIGAFDILREVFFDGIAHDITAMSIQLAVVLNVAFEVIVLHVHSDFTLGDGWSSKVGGAFDEIHLREDLIIANHPCESHAGSQCLGEGAGVHDEVFRIHGDERSDLFAFETQIAVGVVFEDRDLILGDEFHHFLAAFEGHAAAGRVLVVRNDVDEFDIRGGFQIFFQFFRNDAVIIGRDFDVSWLFEIKGTDSAEVGRAFTENDVVFVQEDTTGNVKTLLRAGDDHDVLGFDLFHSHRHVHFVHAISDGFTQAEEAERRAVLHGAGAIFFTDLDSDFGEFLQREGLRSRQTACEGNDIRLRGQSQQGTKVGRTHVFEYIRKTNCHSNLSFQNKKTVSSVLPDDKRMKSQRSGLRDRKGA